MRPIPDDAQRSAAQVLADVPQRLPGFPLSVEDVAMAVDDVAGGRNQQGKRQVGGRFGQHAGVLPTRIPRRDGFGHVDIVETHRIIADDLELRAGGLHELGINRFGKQRHDPFAFADSVQQHVARRRQLFRPDFGVAGFPDAVEPDRRNDAHDEDLGPRH